MKQAVIIYDGNKPVIVAEIKQFESTESFLKVVKEAEKNYADLKEEKKALLKTIDDLKENQRKLYGRILVDEGKITQKEYEDGKY